MELMRLHHDKRNGRAFPPFRGLTSLALIASMLFPAPVMMGAAQAQAIASAPAVQPAPPQERQWLAMPMAMTVQVIPPAVAVDGRVGDPVDPAELPASAVESRREHEPRGVEAER